MSANLWKPIAGAPKDGRPVWTRGRDWGKPDGAFHHGWAYFTEGEWRGQPSQDGVASILKYLTDYMPSVFSMSQGDQNVITE